MKPVNSATRTSGISVGQAVKISGKSRSVVFRAIKNGQISATKNDKGHHLIDKSELARWMDAISSEQATEQTSGLTNEPVEQPKNNAVDALVKAKDETISQQAERIAELKEQLEREQGRADRLEAHLLTDQRPEQVKSRGWLKRLLG
jgi:predicted RNase H-like nuclease (RuvC/YqgF family)